MQARADIKRQELDYDFVLDLVIYEDVLNALERLEEQYEDLKQHDERLAELNFEMAERLDVLEGMKEQLETTREERDLFYDRLKESREQLTALRATVQKELDFMDAFPAVEDGSPIALVIETLRLALASSPASRQEES